MNSMFNMPPGQYYCLDYLVYIFKKKVNINTTNLIGAFYFYTMYNDCKTHILLKQGKRKICWANPQNTIALG